MFGARSFNLTPFGIMPGRGFLPAEDPLVSLPKEWGFLGQFCQELPELIQAEKVNQRARELPIPEWWQILRLQEDPREIRAVWRDYAHAINACVHSQKPPQTAPKNISLPIWFLSKTLNVKPILSYDSYVLNNWARKNPEKDVAVENLALVRTFIRDFCQQWFILIHVDIEQKAALAVDNLGEAVIAAEEENDAYLQIALLAVSMSLDDILATMLRMKEHVSPGEYYKIRPWIMSFKDVIYEGVQEYNGQPKGFRGQTGAQTSIFQSIEAALETPPLSPDNPLAVHLMEMRGYMPSGHRRLIEHLEKRSKVRRFVFSSAPHLTELYDENIEKIISFMVTHYWYADAYIRQQTDNPEGTGGTYFVDYLWGRFQERWKTAFIRPRSESDFKMFVNKVIRTAAA